MVTSICAGCQTAILDKFLLTVLDKAWHVECVRCVVCHIAMETKCFSRDGQLYCREDFFRLFGVKCSGCSRGISPEDLVRRARNAVFHVRCFTCSSCKKEPTTGDELFLLDDNHFICMDDYFAGKHHITAQSSDADTFIINNNNCNIVSSRHRRLEDERSLMVMEMTDETASASSPFSTIDPSSDSLHLTCLSPASAFRPKGTSSSNPQMTFPAGPANARAFDVIHAHARPLLPVDAEYATEVVSGVDKNLRRPEKPNRGKEDRRAESNQGLSKKRGPRTTIKAKQLETLKAAFLHSPKPTRHVRERLAAETSLSMRVIQVWFQNRRSKERRLRQLNGVPAVAHVHQGSMRRPPYYRTHRRLATDAYRLASSSALWAASDHGGGSGGGRLTEARRDTHPRPQQRPLGNYFEGGNGFLLSSGVGHHHHHHHPPPHNRPTAEDCIRILDNSCGSCDNSPVNSSPTTAADDMKLFDAGGSRSASAADSSPPPPSSDNRLSHLIRRSLPLIQSSAAAVASRRVNGVTTTSTTAPDDNAYGRHSFPQQGQAGQCSDE